MPALDPGLRRSLEKAVLVARQASAKAAKAALDTLAVQRSEPFATLSSDERRLRVALRAKARQLEGGNLDRGIPLLVEEVAYEQWHRMLFARFLAENGLLMHPSGVSVTIQDCAELAADQGETDAWQLAARYASRMLPGIFGLEDPSAQVRFAPEGRLALEGILAGLTSAVFTADDGLGWVYQFWQTKRKKEVSSSGEKIERLDLAAYSQLFTEHYMVQFLLENSLGAWWAARHPASPLVNEFNYLRFRDDGTPAAGIFPGWPRRAAEVTVMDPCCGSGHFLVAAFEMLRRMRSEEEGLSEAEAAEVVLRDNLFGLEIDPRCVQIAAFALALAAWKAGGYRPLPALNLACSGIPVGGQLEEWTKLAGGDANLRHALEQLYQLFRNAPGLEQHQVPILYLPGFSRQDVRAVESCPRELQPLAELQYRGVLWTQRNGRDWTIAAFLQTEDGGLGIEVASDGATREALGRALLKLADEPVAALHAEAPLRAPFLDGLLHPDEVKDLLRWLSDPSGFRAAATAAEWEAFVALCLARYRFHPEADGPITAARLLGQRKGAWETVWRRFAEAPASYTAVPEALRQARPEQLPSLVESPESWPQENEYAESSLRRALHHLANVDAQAARRAILNLEQEHAHRRSWVWSAFQQTPLAEALEHLAVLVVATARPLSGASVSEIAAAYAEHGWKADLATLDALAAVESSEDLGAVRAALRTVYRPWLEAGAVRFQQAVRAADPAATYTATPSPAVPDGTCVLFSDGLRYDAAQRLKGMLEGRELECGLTAGLAALPSVTATAKPAVSPAAGAFIGAGDGLAPMLAPTGTKVGVEVLRRTLAAGGTQVLKGEELGDPTGRAWTELGDIDAYGHEHGWRVAHRLDEELRALERRIKVLLGHGWQRVLVVTDHGWLLLPGGLPKADLPEHLTEVRKGRCARLKEGSNTDQQTIPWHWDSSVRFAVAPGIHCYEAGREYEHGGLSPQECVVPILTVCRVAAPAAPTAIESVTWRRLRCTVQVRGATAGLRADLRTRAADPATSLVEGARALGADGEAAFLVADEDREGHGAVVVVIGPDGLPRAQVGTVVGG